MVQGSIAQNDPSSQKVCSSHAYIWTFDIGSIAQITLDIGLFDIRRLHFRVVKVGGSYRLQIEGIGIVILNAALPNGTINHLLIKQVLYVPTLYYNLFGWNVIKSRVAMVTFDDYIHMFNKIDLVNPTFVTNIENEIPRIHEIVHLAYKAAIPPIIAQSAQMFHLAYKVAMPPIITQLAQLSHLAYKVAMSPIIAKSAQSSHLAYKVAIPSIIAQSSQSLHFAFKAAMPPIILQSG